METPRPIGITLKVSFEDEYLEAIGIAYNLVKDSDRYPHRILFSMALMAYFDQCCNASIVDYAQHNIPTTDQEQYIERLQWWPASKKATNLVKQLSENVYISNRDHPIIQTVVQFIKIRNGIAHKVDKYNYVDGEEVTDNPVASTFNVSTEDPFIGQLHPILIEACYNAVIDYTKALASVVAQRDVSMYEFITRNP